MAVAFGYEDPIAPARVLDDFSSSSKKTEIKAGVVGKQAMDVAGVKRLASLQSRDAVVGRLLGTLNAPIRKLVLTLKLASEKESA